MRADKTEHSAVFSIIVPVYNEAENVAGLLQALQSFFTNVYAEVIIVDGGSSDNTYALLQQELDKNPKVFHLLQSAKGRAVQMNAGAAMASGELLVFLHADTLLPKVDFRIVNRLLDEKQKLWGRFDVNIQGRFKFFKVISLLMNWRSRLTGIATGDQCIFVKARAFQQVQPYAEQDLMEDIDMSAKLKRLSSPLCLKQRVKTSGRRWEKYGLWRTIFLMWQLRFDYWRGVPANELAKWYR